MTETLAERHRELVARVVALEDAVYGARATPDEVRDVDPQADWLAPADETRHAQLCRLICENGELRRRLAGVATRLAEFVENAYGNSRGGDATALRAIIDALKPNGQ